MNKKLQKIISIAGIAVIIMSLLMVVGNKMRANAVKEKQEAEKYSEWLSENCNCTKHERFFCKEGFVLNESYCINEDANEITNKLMGCSEYDCSGEIKSWNNETGKWEDKIN